MDPAVVAVVVAVFASITAPLILAVFTARMHRQDREADWARQDILSERAADGVKETNGKLDVIHELVNSNLTAEIQAKLDALITTLAMLHEVIDLKRAAGREPTSGALAAVEATEAKIAEARRQLAERQQQLEAIAAKRAAG